MAFYINMGMEQAHAKSYKLVKQHITTAVTINENKEPIETKYLYRSSTLLIHADYSVLMFPL